MEHFKQRVRCGIYAIEIQTEQIFIRASPGAVEPDPAWTFVDAAGHQHDAGRDTLRHVVDEWCDCWEYCRHPDDAVPSKWHYECIECGEHIKPGTRRTRGRSVPGLRTARLTGPRGRGRAVVDVSHLMVEWEDRITKAMETDSAEYRASQVVGALQKNPRLVSERKTRPVALDAVLAELMETAGEEFVLEYSERR